MNVGLEAGYTRTLGHTEFGKQEIELREYSTIQAVLIYI